jgi:hypothetical protein
VSIAAVYSFKDQSARCGVSGCLQAHSRGFLVITSDAKETNLCEARGQRFFDVSFEAQKNTLQEQARIRDQKIRLNTVLEQADVIKERINDLKQAPKGANWLYRVFTSFYKTYPANLLAALKELVTNKDENTILAALAENEADPSQLEHVEQLQGLGIFAADIREELIGKILKSLIELEEQFACAEYLVEEGRAFFDTENLERLKSIPLPEDSARLVRSLHWDCDKAAAKRR